MLLPHTPQPDSMHPLLRRRPLKALRRDSGVLHRPSLNRTTLLRLLRQLNSPRLSNGAIMERLLRSPMLVQLARGVRRLRKPGLPRRSPNAFRRAPRRDSIHSALPLARPKAPHRTARPRPRRMRHLKRGGRRQSRPLRLPSNNPGERRRLRRAKRPRPRTRMVPRRTPPRLPRQRTKSSIEPRAHLRLPSARTGRPGIWPLRQGRWLPLRPRPLRGHSQARVRPRVCAPLPAFW